MKNNTEMTAALELLPIDFRKKIENAHKKALANPKPCRRVATQKEKVVRLPLWPDGARGVPNGLLRSSLFSAVKRGRRKMFDDDVVSIAGINIKYTGYQLNQNDLTAWESILHEARGLALGDPVRVTAYQLLKIQQKRDNGQNRHLLLDRIERLVNGTVKIKTERYTYIGGLIHDAIRDDDTHEWAIWLNPRLRPLFAQDQYTLIDWQVRLSLDGKALAQWLHTFYASHQKPLAYKVETIKVLCGSEAKSMRHFRERLRDAMRDVERVTRWKIWLESDLLHIKK